jgi:hypothetical protein
MAENPFTKPGDLSTPAPTPAFDRAAIAQSEPEVVSGASWFWWIAGLSLINSVLLHSGSDTSLAIGLGFTLMVDAIFQEIKVVAFIIDALALATVCGLGYYARKGYVWAFVVGIVLYSLDALIYLGLQAWIGMAIHAFALFYMIRGALRLRAALKAAAEPPPVLAAAAEPVPVRIIDKP